ncbi:putative ferric-chelate reductase 1 isoform X2 [Oncorhynchus keta]|uniref:putative ferric-chelate reductase 1 isoform X2 n=1 Tax=Oncorhynchus keta TaxID=8018 RepID=UPI00227C0579|nr:putative ferric-chelate reductase 1 isoform X2 [Oncorhynchus keta]
MCSAQMVLIILIGIATIETVTGFSGGASNTMSCDTMLPHHGSPTPESGPFSVPKHFCSSAAGDETIVSLKADPATKFKGFLLEARESQDGPAVGTFTLLTPAHSLLLECSGNPAAAVTQPNNQAKTLIEAKWRAPYKGVFYFRVTFIKDMMKFWIPEAINITTCPTTSTVTPTTITTSTVTPTTITPPTTPAITPPTIPAITIPAITAPAIPTPTIPTPTIPTPTIPTPTPALHTSAPSTCMLISALIRPSLLFVSLPKGQTLWHKGFKILLCPLSMVAAIIAFIILLLWEPIQITLVAVVGVAMVLSLGQTIVVFLPFGPSHELRSICDLVLRVISFTTEVFTMVAIFVSLEEIEKCCSIHWRMKEMGGYAAWVALFYLMFIYLCCNQSYQRKRIGDKWIVPKRTIIFEKIFNVILVLGKLGFTVALIIGIYT